MKLRRWAWGLGISAALVLALDLAFPLPRQDSASQSTLIVLAEDGTPLRSWASADGALRFSVQLAAVSPST